MGVMNHWECSRGHTFGVINRAGSLELHSTLQATLTRSQSRLIRRFCAGDWCDDRKEEERRYRTR